MAKQSEQILEEQLIAQLQKLGYGYIVIQYAICTECWL
jgi:hypothetical protein